MLTALIVCLCLRANVHAGSIASSDFTSTTATPEDNTHVATTPCSSLDMDQELAKIANSCMTIQEHEQLTDNSLRPFLARMFNRLLLGQAVDVIAFTEMRAALGIRPPGPWTKYRWPSKAELASASTIEEYFDLKEKSKDRSLDSEFFFEKDFPPAIAFLDKRFPGFRNIFKCRFQKFRTNLKEGIDRKTVDDIIHEYGKNILPKVTTAITEIFFNYECK